MHFISPPLAESDERKEVEAVLKEEYEKSEFKATYKQPKLILRESKVFLRNKFILHNVPYADENPWRNLILAADNRTASWTSATTHNKNEKILTSMGVVYSCGFMQAYGIATEAALNVNYLYE